MDNFFGAPQLIKRQKNLIKPYDKEIKHWKKFKKWANRKFHFDKIAKGPYLDMIMLIVVLLNTVWLIFYSLKETQDEDHDV